MIRIIWAAPVSAVGLLVIIVAAWRVQLQIVEGALEAHGPALAWLLGRATPIGASAMTLGHVIIARDQHALDLTRAHERVHVRQCELWGPLFVPAYLIASMIAVMRGRHFYFGNAFEIEAFNASGTSAHK